MARPKGREKNQLFRLFILDYHLKQRDKYYSREDLLNICNLWLHDHEIIGADEFVSRRTVDTDLEFLGYVKPGHEPKSKTWKDVFNAEFEEQWVFDEKLGRGKRAIRYKDPDFSIFERKLTTAERDLLLSVMRTMGSFKGIPEFELFGRLEEKLYSGGMAPKESNPRKIVDFGFQPVRPGSVNPMAFFPIIEEKKACRIVLSPLAPPRVKRFIVSPYQIRQYNGSWFLVARDNGTGSVRSIAINWIETFLVIEEADYITYSDGRIEDRFKDVVGVTVEKTTRLSTITFAAKPDRARYMLANPFHHSLAQVDAGKEAELREKHTGLPSDWIILTMECKINQELYTKFLSYGNQLVVLEPERMANEMREKAVKMLELYSK